MAWAPSHSITADEIWSEKYCLESLEEKPLCFRLFKSWLRAGLEPTKFHSLASPSFGLKNCIGTHTIEARDSQLKRPTIKVSGRGLIFGAADPSPQLVGVWVCLNYPGAWHFHKIKHKTKRKKVSVKQVSPVMDAIFCQTLLHRPHHSLIKWMVDRMKRFNWTK